MPTEKPNSDSENNSFPEQEPKDSNDADLFSAPGQTTQERRETVKPTERSRTIGNYKLLQQIGTGGMGQVWMAEQTQPVRRRVAIKLIKTGLDNKQVSARFEAERQALAMMDHNCIAKVFDAGSTPDGQPYFVMELVQGIPITKYCDANRLSLNERLSLFMFVCAAVQHAHQKGIIHRDLKPSNILVTLYDGQPIPKIIDFGLAKALEHQTRLTDQTLFTEFGQVVGTLQYMSPEQAEMNALDVDTRTDIYSLGVLLYELLTGTTPIDADTLAKQAILKVLETIREKEPPRPSVRLSESRDAIAGISKQRRIEPKKLQQLLRGDLDWIVMKSIEKDRRRRYETAIGLGDDVQRFLSNESVSARPPSSAYKLQKFVNKNRGLVVSLFTIFCVLVIGIAGTGLYAWKANLAEGQAVIDRDIARTADTKAQQDRVEAERDRGLALAREQEAINAKNQTEQVSARANYWAACARWEKGRINDATSLLASIPEKFRNLEWFRQDQIFKGYRFSLNFKDTRPTCICWSPDGKWAVSGHSNGVVQIRDFSVGAIVRNMKGSNSPIVTMAISSSGKYFATGSEDRIRLWQIEDGKLIKSIKSSTSLPAIAFNSDSSLLATNEEDGKIVFRFPDTGAIANSIKNADLRSAKLRFHPNGRLIATCSYGAKVKVVKIENGDEVYNTSGSDFDFNPDGSMFVVIAENRLSFLEDNFNKVSDPIVLNDAVSDIRFSPTGDHIAGKTNGRAGMQLQVFDLLRNGQGLNLVPLSLVQSQPIVDFAFGPDGDLLLTADKSLDSESNGSLAGSLKLWNIDSLSGAISIRSDWSNRRINILGLDEPEAMLAYSSDGRSLATTDGSMDITLRDSATGKVQKCFSGYETVITSLAVGPDGSLIASGGKDGSIGIWDAKNGNLVRTVFHHSDMVASLCFDHYGTTVLSASWDGKVNLIDARTGRLLKTHHLGDQRCYRAVFKNVLGEFYALTNKHLKMVTLESDTATNLMAIQLGGEEGMQRCVDLALNSKTNTAAVKTADRIVLLNLADNSMSELVGGDSAIASIAFTPDGSRILSLDGDSIRIWDCQDRVELQSWPQTPNLTSITMNPMGNSFAVTSSWSPGSAEATIHLMNCTSREQPSDESINELNWMHAVQRDEQWHQRRSNSVRQIMEIASMKTQQKNVVPPSWATQIARCSTLIHSSKWLRNNPNNLLAYLNFRKSYNDYGDGGFPLIESRTNACLPQDVVESLEISRGTEIELQDLDELFDRYASPEVYEILKMKAPIPFAIRLSYRGAFKDAIGILELYREGEQLGLEGLRALADAHVQVGDIQAALDIYTKLCNTHGFTNNRDIGSLARLSFRLEVEQNKSNGNNYVRRLGRLCKTNQDAWELISLLILADQSVAESLVDDASRWFSDKNECKNDLVTYSGNWLLGSVLARCRDSRKEAENLHFLNLQELLLVSGEFVGPVSLIAWTRYFDYLAASKLRRTDFGFGLPEVDSEVLFEILPKILKESITETERMKTWTNFDKAPWQLRFAIEDLEKAIELAKSNK